MISSLPLVAPFPLSCYYCTLICCRPSQLPLMTSTSVLLCPSPVLIDASSWGYDSVMSFPCSRLVLSWPRLSLTSSSTFPVAHWVLYKDAPRVLKIPFLETEFIMFTTSPNLPHPLPSSNPYPNHTETCQVISEELWCQSFLSLSTLTHLQIQQVTKIMFILSPKCPKYFTDFIFMPSTSSSCHFFCLMSLRFPIYCSQLYRIISLNDMYFHVTCLLKAFCLSHPVKSNNT